MEKLDPKQFNKTKTIAVIVIIACFAIIFIVNGILNNGEIKEPQVDISSLSFSPVGTWVDLSDGQLMFKIYSNGVLEYMIDTGNMEKGTWSVIDENVMNFVLGSQEYEIQLVDMEGHNIIGNDYSTFCLEDDYEEAHEDIYVPAMSDE